jgi:hypothetical protein
MKTRPRLVCLVLALVALALSGCAEIGQDLAERPYRKAMQSGRMSPSEYQRKMDEIDQAARAAAQPSSGRSDQPR